MSGLIEGLYEVIGTPNNFAGEIVLLTIGGILFVFLLCIVMSWMFRIGRR